MYLQSKTYNSAWYIGVTANCQTVLFRSMDGIAYNWGLICTILILNPHYALLTHLWIQPRFSGLKFCRFIWETKSFSLVISPTNILWDHVGFRGPDMQLLSSMKKITSSVKFFTLHTQHMSIATVLVEDFCAVLCFKQRHSTTYSSVSSPLSDKWAWSISAIFSSLLTGGCFISAESLKIYTDLVGDCLVQQTVYF